MLEAQNLMAEYGISTPFLPELTTHETGIEEVGSPLERIRTPAPPLHTSTLYISCIGGKYKSMNSMIHPDDLMLIHITANQGLQSTAFIPCGALDILEVSLSTGEDGRRYYEVTVLNHGTVKLPLTEREECGCVGLRHGWFSVGDMLLYFTFRSVCSVEADDVFLERTRFLFDIMEIQRKVFIEQTDEVYHHPLVITSPASVSVRSTRTSSPVSRMTAISPEVDPLDYELQLMTGILFKLANN
jgi:hypothetical protein